MSSADIVFAELNGDGWLADPDLPVSGAGDDARERLAQAAAALRDVARIIENRQRRPSANARRGLHITSLSDPTGRLSD